MDRLVFSGVLRNWILIVFSGLVALSGCGGGAEAGPPNAASGFELVDPNTPPVVSVPLPPTPPTVDTVVPPVASGGIATALSASRVSGVAPLSVFFDASATTSVATARPFHDLEYQWSFGDASSGAWSVGSRAGVSSRNLARGPVASHVFETPGTYTVTVTASDGANAAANTVQIIVQDPNTVFSGNTICFSTSGIFTGCPAGAATQTTSNFAAAINSNQSSKKRLLFRRGETFTATGGASLTTAGPGIIGAFGSGVAPKWSIPYGVTALGLSSQDTPKTVGDWRVMDIEMDGQDLNASAINANGGINQILMLRLNIHNVVKGIFFSSGTLDYLNSNGYPGHTIWDQVAVVDTRLNTINGGNAGSGMNGAFIAAERFSFMGNDWDAANGGEHVLRMHYIGKGVVSNNYLARPAAAKIVIKLHAGTFGASGVRGGGYSEKIVISDNTIVGGVNDWNVVIGPQNNVSDERIRNVIFERNYILLNGHSHAAFICQNGASFITARNNIVNHSLGTDAFISFWIFTDSGVAPLVTNISILNNTAYSSASHAFTAWGTSVGSTPTNIIVKNNTYYAPNATSYTAMNGTGGSGFDASNNSTTSQFKSVNPLFSSIPVATTKSLLETDFKVSASSYTVGTGISVPVIADFYLRSRSGVIPDMGAVNH